MSKGMKISGIILFIINIIAFVMNSYFLIAQGSVLNGFVAVLSLFAAYVVGSTLRRNW